MQANTYLFWIIFPPAIIFLTPWALVMPLPVLKNFLVEFEDCGNIFDVEVVCKMWEISIGFLLMASFSSSLPDTEITVDVFVVLEKF